MADSPIGRIIQAGPRNCVSLMVAPGRLRPFKFVISSVLNFRFTHGSGRSSIIGEKGRSRPEADVGDSAVAVRSNMLCL